jgi:hypothetical protein
VLLLLDLLLQLVLQTGVGNVDAAVALRNSCACAVQRSGEQEGSAAAWLVCSWWQLTDAWQPSTYLGM